MKCHWDVDGHKWRLAMQLHPEDPVHGGGQGGMTVGLLATEARVRLPVAVAEPHPDLVALATLVITLPWIKHRLVLDRPVSRHFADLAQQILKIEVGPVDDHLAPRTGGQTPVLGYSAGFDSAAASLLLPEGIPHIHHRRTAHPRIPNRSAWRIDAIEHLVKRAASRGRNVDVVAANFEYLCHPYPTLPNWFGFAVGPLLLADHHNAGAIALGGTLETFYMDMGRRWTGGPVPGSGIDPLPAAVGMPILRPVMGVTEIGTMRLVLESDLHDASRSCVVGTFDKPCGRCAKCIRKDMLAAAVTGQVPDSIATLSADAPGWQSINNGTSPIYMQAQFEYALARLDVNGLPLAELRDRLSPDAAETDWMDRAYRPAIERGLTPPWADDIAKRIEAQIGWMTADDERRAEAWDRIAA